MSGRQVLNAVMVTATPLTDLHGYESKRLSVPGQAWERHGVQDWPVLGEIVVTHF